MGRGGGGQIIKQSAGQVWLDLTPLCVFLIGSRECSRQQAECRELKTFLQVLHHILSRFTLQRLTPEGHIFFFFLVAISLPLLIESYILGTFISSLKLFAISRVKSTLSRPEGILPCSANYNFSLPLSLLCTKCNF